LDISVRSQIKNAALFIGDFNLPGWDWKIETKTKHSPFKKPL
jgi:hypothetical protein